MDNHAEWQQLTLDQKKWEFLRRHKPYRNDWNEASGPHAQKLIAEKYSLKILVDPKLDWRKLPKGFGFNRPPQPTFILSQKTPCVLHGIASPFNLLAIEILSNPFS